MRRFEFVGRGSSKFWEIAQTGSQVTVQFGRLGSNGQSQTKDFKTWDEAAERVRKLVAEKLREGYIEVQGSGHPSANLPDFREPPIFPRYQVPAMPEDGPLALGNVQLPAGRRLRGDPQFAPSGGVTLEQPVIWATSSSVDFAGRSLYWLRPDAAALNLVPVMLSGLDSEPGRPWDSGEFAPADPRGMLLIDVSAELAHAWSASIDVQDEESTGEELAPVRPFGKKFPGLASQPASLREVRSDGDVLDQIRGKRIGLVAADRPADVVAALGWMGAVNVHDNPAFLSAVLRSWEVRWYARLVEIGFDTLTLTVGQPPRDQETAVALAAEHFAFCPDNVLQGSETIQTYAQGLVNARTWNFWWD